MTRRGSRSEGRQPDAGRPAAPYATGTPDRDGAMRACACGAVYRDHHTGAAAHRTVFGHQPVRKPAPAAAESAPEQHQEGARWTG